MRIESEAASSKIILQFIYEQNYATKHLVSLKVGFLFLG